MTLGAKIKLFRKEKNITIKELSELTNLSSGFISNIENNLNSPSISNLQQICKALDMNIVELIESDNTKSCIIRNTERKNIFNTPDNSVRFELVSNPDKDLNVMCITIEPNSEYDSTDWGHTFDEIGLVIKGVLEIKVKNDVYTLNEGDSIYINKYTAHNYKNVSEEKCVIYWFSAKK